MVGAYFLSGTKWDPCGGGFTSARNSKYNLHKTVNGLVLHLFVQNRTVLAGENYD